MDRLPSTIVRSRPRHQIAQQLPGAQQHQLEVVVCPAAACDVVISAAPGRVVSCDASRDRPRLCEVCVLVCRCKNVLVSSMCRTMELCVGVCTVGVHARVLARACGRVPRKRCRTTLLAPETARPLSSCITTGPGCEREAHRHAVAVHRFLYSAIPRLSRRLGRRALAYSLPYCLTSYVSVVMGILVSN